MSNNVVPAGTIVVGVDGSAPSESALVWAGEQAAIEGRAVTLVHAVNVPSLAGMGGYGGDGTIFEVESRDGRALLGKARAALEKAHEGIEVRTRFERYDPQSMLLDLSQDAALVVVGSRGRGPVQSLVLGSVSAAVSRHAACPVVVVRAYDPESPNQGVLVGVDEDGSSSAAVGFAYRQASERGGPLTVVHCVVDTETVTEAMPAVAFDAPGLEADRLALDETVAGMAEKFPDVAVSLVLARGPAADVLIQASRSMGIVVVGSHPGFALSRLFFDRAIDRTVVGHAACVVAVVPELTRR